MPGIVGLVGTGDGGGMAAALEKISYLETYERTVLRVSSTLTLGIRGQVITEGLRYLG